jgi:hypothetical protein
MKSLCWYIASHEPSSVSAPSRDIWDQIWDCATYLFHDLLSLTFLFDFISPGMSLQLLNLHGKTGHSWPSSIAYLCHEALSTSCQFHFGLSPWSIHPWILQDTRCIVSIPWAWAESGLWTVAQKIWGKSSISSTKDYDRWKSTTILLSLWQILIGILIDFETNLREIGMIIKLLMQMEVEYDVQPDIIYLWRWRGWSLMQLSMQTMTPIYWSKHLHLAVELTCCDWAGQCWIKPFFAHPLS